MSDLLKKIINFAVKKHNDMKRIIFLILAVISVNAYAQPKQIYSPTCNADGSVTFTMKAPHAKYVELACQCLTKNVPMQKDDAGLWTVTITPEEPDIYPYNFIVDGTSVNDPGNKLLFPNEFFKQSILEMPNANPLYYTQDVPHGKVEYVTYYSEQFKQWRPLVIYIPASYSKDTDKNYPVFYLMSGTTDTEETWTKLGKANVIADNLIAQGKAEEMIIVMPFGYINEDTAPGWSEGSIPQYKVFENDFVNGIMPFVEKNYRTINDADHRAIAGFSRGGGQALFVGYRNIDKFHSVIAFSSWLTAAHFEHIPNFLTDVKQLKMHWLYVGEKDPYFQHVKKNIDLLNNKNVKADFFTTKHAHTWMHCRIVLSEALQKLFK